MVPRPAPPPGVVVFFPTFGSCCRGYLRWGLLTGVMGTPAKPSKQPVAALPPPPTDEAEPTERSKFSVCQEAPGSSWQTQNLLPKQENISVLILWYLEGSNLRQTLQLHPCVPFSTTVKTPKKNSGV